MLLLFVVIALVQTSSFSENTLATGRQLVGLRLEEIMYYTFQTFGEHRVDRPDRGANPIDSWFKNSAGSLESAARLPPVSRPPPPLTSAQLTLRVETPPGGLEKPTASHEKPG